MGYVHDIPLPPPLLAFCPFSLLLLSQPVSAGHFVLLTLPLLFVKGDIDILTGKLEGEVEFLWWNIQWFIWTCGFVFIIIDNASVSIPSGHLQVPAIFSNIYETSS